MAKNLVIVESPAKAKTIEKYLGSDYKVLSSFGHVRDLPKKGLAVDIDNNFEPTYEITPDKKKTITELKKAVRTSQTVWLASDEDREGEAIAWHLVQALGLDESTSKRIVFHEITKSAITAAIQSPRTIDQPLVDAQQARRVLDRLVGYELSPVLWKKVRPGLSAGRVQSVAVRLIVEREREIAGFESTGSYKVTGALQAKKEEVPVEASTKFDDEKSARKFLTAVAKSKLQIESIEQTPGTRRPSPPFTTSTMQQEAARKLGYSVRQTMNLAQRLYEAGHITYMRTDSLNLAQQAVSQAVKEIEKEFSKDYVNITQYKTKSRGAQEAHEAIRPTEFARTTAGEDEQQSKLYRLIRNRAMASQMAPARIERTTITIPIDGEAEFLIAKGEILQFPGFMALIGTKDDIILPALEKGDSLNLGQLTARQTFNKPPARYSESALVKKLEELGIGRPSTYAPTISTIQSRGYVEKADVEGMTREVNLIELNNTGQIQDKTEPENYGNDKNKLLPTSTAEQVTDFLVKHFPEIVDYDFTAEVEDRLDDIADGDKQWQAVIKEFYKPFQKTVEKSESISRADAAQARLVGHDPKTKAPIYARFGRFGPMLQRGETSDDKKPDFAPLPPGNRIETVDLQTALKAFELPRQLGKTDDGREILASIGRFGPYIKVGDKFISIKGEDPYTIDLDKAKEFMEAAAKREAAKYIARFEKEGVDVLNGRFGPYITDGKKNAKIPKDVKPEEVTLEMAQKLLAEAPTRKRRPRRRA